MCSSGSSSAPPATGSAPVDRGQPFALKHRGLLSSPEDLVTKGYSIVHSVKSDDPASEQATVDHFRRLRGTDPAR